MSDEIRPRDVALVGVGLLIATFLLVFGAGMLLGVAWVGFRFIAG